MSITYTFLEVFRKPLLDNTYVIKGGRDFCFSSVFRDKTRCFMSGMFATFPSTFVFPNKNCLGCEHAQKNEREGTQHFLLYTLRKLWFIVSFWLRHMSHVWILQPNGTNHPLLVNLQAPNPPCDNYSFIHESQRPGWRNWL